jgi:hypothetical protein
LATPPSTGAERTELAGDVLAATVAAERRDSVLGEPREQFVPLGSGEPASGETDIVGNLGDAVGRRAEACRGSMTRRLTLPQTPSVQLTSDPIVSGVVPAMAALLCYAVQTAACVTNVRNE